MGAFLQGLPLARAFYHEAVAPIVADFMPDLRYSAGLVGPQLVLPPDGAVLENQDGRVARKAVRISELEEEADGPGRLGKMDRRDRALGAGGPAVGGQFHGQHIVLHLSSRRVASSRSAAAPRIEDASRHPSASGRLAPLGSSDEGTGAHSRTVAGGSAHG